MKEYASLVKYYCEKEKARENVTLEWDNLVEIQKNAMVLREYPTNVIEAKGEEFKKQLLDVLSAVCATQSYNRERRIAPQTKAVSAPAGTAKPVATAGHAIKSGSKIELDIDYEKLYFNMLDCKADWLYNLPQWEPILTPERRKEITMEFRSSKMYVKQQEPNRNDPCPCGSGKKYKKCCGKDK